MNILDIIILLCFIPGIITGISKGFIAQLMGLVSVVMGIWLAFNFSNALTIWMKSYVNMTDNVLHVIAFAVILILCIVVLGLVAKALTSVIKVIMLGWLNRLLGAFFSFFTTFIVLGMIVLFLNWMTGTFEIQLPALFHESQVYGWLQRVTLNIFPQLKAMFF